VTVADVQILERTGADIKAGITWRLWHDETQAETTIIATENHPNERQELLTFCGSTGCDGHEYMMTINV
jgi:hypothetical protein